MPKCPECKEEINKLIHYTSIRACSEFDGTERTERMYKRLPDEDEFLDEDDSYDCPKCRTMLFMYEDSAITYFEESA